MSINVSKKVLIISGSPRKESKSVRVAKYLYNELKFANDFEPVMLDVRDYPLPVFENVFENVESTPEMYKPIAKKILHADAYIVITPEYNGSYTSTIQNLFDHFPRQQKKVYGVVTATNGSMGGMRASQQLLLLIVALFGIVSPYMLITPFVDKKFDEEGVLVDTAFKPKVDFFLDQFKWLVCKVDIT